VGEGKRGQTAAAAAAAGQSARQYQAGKLVFLAAFLVFVFFVVRIFSFVFRFHYFTGERQTGDFASPAHPSSQKNLRQMALLSIAVQAVFDFCIQSHRFTFR
jgi:hypothetical protein